MGESDGEKPKNKVYKILQIMEQYIPKSALVAEIEKLISNGKFQCQQSQEYNDQESYIAWSEHIATCEKILSSINTLEVKEVDSFDATVCKIGNVYLKEIGKDVIAKVLEPYKNGDRVKVIIKAQKGE